MREETVRRTEGENTRCRSPWKINFAGFKKSCTFAAEKTNKYEEVSILQSFVDGFFLVPTCGGIRFRSAIGHGVKNIG